MYKSIYIFFYKNKIYKNILADMYIILIADNILYY